MCCHPPQTCTCARRASTGATSAPATCWSATGAAQQRGRPALAEACSLTGGTSLTPLTHALSLRRDAYNEPWGGSPIRYVGDGRWAVGGRSCTARCSSAVCSRRPPALLLLCGRPFWRHIVQSSTGCDAEGLFEELYTYYARGDSYALVPGAADALTRIRAAGARPAALQLLPPLGRQAGCPAQSVLQQRARQQRARQQAHALPGTCRPQDGGRLQLGHPPAGHPVRPGRLAPL